MTESEGWTVMVEACCDDVVLGWQRRDSMMKRCRLRQVTEEDAACYACKLRLDTERDTFDYERFLAMQNSSLMTIELLELSCKRYQIFRMC